MPDDKRKKAAERGDARVLTPERHQVELREFHLDGAIPADHRVRAVWAFVEGLDLSRLYRGIGSVEGGAGRPATDPRILMALWLQATIEGVGSARAVERLCEEHMAYQWICGGVGVNNHTLSDFRVENGEVLDELLTQSVAALMKEGVVELTRVAQDGVKVRASAGASSFRRTKTLRACKREAREQVAALKKELHEDPAGSSRRQQAARQRVAQDRLERVTRALKLAEELEKEKPTSKQEIRVSTTDPDARVMKMGDGGFRPAYNVQLSSDTESQVVVGIEVITAGNDQAELIPMIDQLEKRYGVVPAEVLVDGGYTAHSNLDALEGRTTVIAPVPRPKDSTLNPYKPKPTDSPAVAKWRKRMATVRAKRIYKERAATAECVNAQARNRGLLRFLVRGLQKVRAVALLYALAHNMSRALAFGLLGEPAAVAA
jgi:transposase